MSRLPVVDCHGCGVCCLHMGFPAFNLTADQLARWGEPSVRNEPAESRVSESKLSQSAVADLSRWRRMPQELRDQVLDLMRTYQPPPSGELDGPCIWLDATTRLCRHHQHRPQVCRDFPVGGAGCLDWRNALPECLQDM